MPGVGVRWRGWIGEGSNFYHKTKQHQKIHLLSREVVRSRECQVWKWTHPHSTVRAQRDRALAGPEKGCDISSTDGGSAEPHKRGRRSRRGGIGEPGPKVRLASQFPWAAGP